MEAQERPKQQLGVKNPPQPGKAVEPPLPTVLPTALASIFFLSREKKVWKWVALRRVAVSKSRVVSAVCPEVELGPTGMNLWFR